MADFLRLQARKVNARLIKKSMASRIPIVRFVAKKAFQKSPIFIFEIQDDKGLKLIIISLFGGVLKNPRDCIRDADRQEEGVVAG